MPTGTLDVTDESDLAAAAVATAESEIDILVNAAGKPFGIAVSVIQPGGIDTPFAEAERRTYHHGSPEGPCAETLAHVLLGLHDGLPARLWDRLLPALAPTPRA